MINKKFWIGKKVLITGHTGFKGCWLSIWMKMLGAKIAGYSLDPITKKNFFELAKLKKIFDIDQRNNIQDFKTLDNCIKKFRPSIIFHLAAQPQVLESFDNPYDTVKTNVIGTTNLLEIARKYKFIKSLIIITTDKVYRNTNKKIKFSEDHALGGDDIYSSSKASADIIASSYNKSFFKYSQCGLAIARAGNCIGGGDWTKFRILTDASEAFLKNKKLIVRNPNSIRPWQHVLEPLLGYIILAQKNFSNVTSKYSGSWNFGPVHRKHYKVKDFVNLFKLKLESKSKIIFKRTEDNREKNFLDLSSKKSIKILKWKPILNIDQTLELTARWYLAYKQKKNLFRISSKQIQYFTHLFK